MIKRVVFLIILLSAIPAYAGQKLNSDTGKKDFTGLDSIGIDCSAETTEGRICWDSDDDKLYVGDGAAVVEIASGGGSGDITAVGDCSTGACFNGTSGSILTFNNVSGDQTLSFDNTTQDFELSNDLTITDTDPHLKWKPSSGDSFEAYAFDNEWWFNNVTDAANILRIRPDNTLTITPDVTITGNDLNFGNGESISNTTDGRIAFNFNQATSETIYLGYNSDTTIDFSSSTGLATMQIPWYLTFTADDKGILLGASNDARMEWDTAETNDALKIGVDVGSAAQSGNFLIVEDADMGVNTTLASHSNPWFAVHSADSAVPSDYISLTHDQTDPILGFGNTTAEETLKWSNSDSDFLFSDDVNISDTDPHIRLTPSSGNAYEIYAFSNELYLSNYTSGAWFLRTNTSDQLILRGNGGIYFDPDADNSNEVVFNSDGSITTTGAGTERIQGDNGEYIDFDDGGDGKICMGGSGGSNNETWCFDFETTANALAISSLSLGSSIRFTGGGSVWGGTVSTDGGTGAYGFKADGSSGGCLMLRDTDDAGWTECCALNGVLTCAIDADGTIDGTL